ncbi:putative candidate secreted effector protein [Blumeria hordei DH14]|uniref:Putative candidate secreted effector protein n=1 Tax=Blumeria graminis f. sp. hordei (strain DH14) TaxID=546991 RepID=N1JR23_BLUG1|nr:putative candidate secreted effector protein [Blumeria hordei DH14]
MKSSALVFFAALLSYLMPVLGALYYNCEESLIFKATVIQRVREKHQELVAQGLQPDQFQAGSTFGQVIYDTISAVEPNNEMEITITFDKNQFVLSVQALCLGRTFNCPAVEYGTEYYN